MAVLNRSHGNEWLYGYLELGGDQIGFLGIGGNKTNTSRSGQKFPMMFTENDFTTNDHQMLISTDEWTEIAYYTVPAQREVMPGYGDPGHPENEGRVYAFIRTGEATPVEITGKWRIVVRNRAKNWSRVIQEFDEELTHGDLNDKRKLLPLQASGVIIGEDDVLSIQVKPNSTHVGSGAGADNVGFEDSTETAIPSRTLTSASKAVIPGSKSGNCT